MDKGISFIGFELHPNEDYGVPYPYVQEILPHTKIEKPPFVPPFIAGVINWQGFLITVVDLNKFFHRKQSKCSNGYIIIISTEESTLGLLVPNITGTAVYQPGQLDSPLSSVGPIHPDYLLGVHHTAIGILHVDALVTGLSLEIKGEVHG